MSQWKETAKVRRDFRQGKDAPEAPKRGAKKKRVRNFAVRYKMREVSGFKFWPSYFEKLEDAEKTADKYLRQGWIADVIDMRNT